MSLPLLTTRSFVVRVFFSMRANISFIKPLVILLFFTRLFLIHLILFPPSDLPRGVFLFYYYYFIGYFVCRCVLISSHTRFLSSPVFLEHIFYMCTNPGVRDIQVWENRGAFLFHRFFVDSEIKWPIWGDKTRGFLFFQFRGLREILLSYIFPKQKRN